MYARPTVLSLPQADEYVVYTAHQQRMQYLVEFTLPDDSVEEAGEEEEEEEGEEEEEMKKKGNSMEGGNFKFNHLNIVTF